MKKTTVSLLVLSAVILSTAGSAAAIDIPSWFSETGKAIKNFFSPIIAPYPFYRVEVRSPNGGEVWGRSQIQEIKWQVYYPAYKQDEQSPELKEKLVSIDLYEKRWYRPEDEIKCETEKEKCLFPSIPYTFVKHVATTNILDKSYKWKISDDIPNGKNYIIRITPLTVYPVLQGDSNSVENKPESANVISSYWDESDGTFSITGQNPDNKDLEEAIRSLKKIRANLLSTADKIQKLIELLENLEG